MVFLARAFILVVIVGWTGPEETRGRADRGRGRYIAAAQRHCGRALQETSPQKCAEEEAGGGETVGPSVVSASELTGCVYLRSVSACMTRGTSFQYILHS